MNGKYRLGRLIGGGGMAEVFEATALGAEGFARPVAIKRMLPALSLDPSFGQMFVNEARLASLLHHENIVSVLDFDRDPEGRFFIAMELVRGVDLRRLASSGPLPWGVIAFVLAEVLGGLGYAHELESGGRPLRIVHRDISPHNVMVSWDGAVKVVDFGIAKALAATGASRSNSLKGKMAYMSPEQAHGLELDGRADVFAVGVMGHELMTGARLFPGQTEVEILARLLTQPIPWPRQVRGDVPPNLEAVVMRMLERDREARFPSAQVAHEAILATRVVDPRAQIQLRELMKQRFAEAPRRRGESQPNFVATPSGPVPTADLTLTAPEGGNARAVMSASTRTAQPAYGQTPVTAPRSRAPLWIALTLLGAAAAITVAVIARGGAGGAAPGGGAGSGSSMVAVVAVDAAPVAVATPDAAPVAVATPDAAPEIPPPPVVIDAAALREPAGGHHHRPDAGVGAAGGPASHPDGHGTPTPPAPPPDAAPAIPAIAGAAPDAAPARPGTISIKVNPWAHVYIDGVLAGDTPLVRSYPPGTHKIRLVNEDVGKDETTSVTVDSGGVAEVRRSWNE